MKKRRNPHVGGQQLPLIVPDSDWKPPSLSDLPDLTRFRRVALDTETRDDGLSAGRGPGWAHGAGHVCGVGLAWEGGSVYLPLRHPDTECVDRDQVRGLLERLFRSDTRVAMQNGPYDVGWLAADMGLAPPLHVDDTTAMAVMIDENRTAFDLDSLCEWRGVVGKDESLLREAAAAYGVDVKSGLHLLPARFVAPYGAGDPAATLTLAEDLDAEIDAQGMREAYQVEMDLIPMVHEMRRRGIRVDTDAAERARDELRARSERALAELTREMGERVTLENVRSPQWLENRLTAAGVKFPWLASGRGSFEATWMRGHAHPLPRLVSVAKMYAETADKFLQGFIIDYAHHGRLHANINQFRGEDGGTRSHRFSYSDPALQQMPMRDEELSEFVRGAFLPEEGDLWFTADYSQQEFRLIVHFAEAMELRKASEAAGKYRDDPSTDFHMLVVALTGLERKPAKDTNFAKSFGAGKRKFASMTGMTLERAAEVMDQYDREMPFVSELAKECERLAGLRGWIRMLDGARSHFDEWECSWLDDAERNRGYRERWLMAPCSRQEAEERRGTVGHPWHGRRLRRAYIRKAMNRLIQGSAARQTKRAMRDCWRAGHVPMLQMHDDLNFSLSDETRGAEIACIMRDAVRLRVPMLVDMEWGTTWGRARKRPGYGATFAEALAAAGGGRAARPGPAAAATRAAAGARSRGRGRRAPVAS